MLATTKRPETDASPRTSGSRSMGRCLNQRRPLSRSCSTFNDFAKGFDWPQSVEMILELRPTMFYDRNRSGWSLDFWACGFGQSRAAAREVWALAITRFTSFIDVDNERWRIVLAKKTP